MTPCLKSYQTAVDGLVWFHGQDSNGTHLQEHLLLCPSAFFKQDPSNAFQTMKIWRHQSQSKHYPLLVVGNAQWQTRQINHAHEPGWYPVLKLVLPVKSLGQLFTCVLGMSEKIQTLDIQRREPLFPLIPQKRFSLLQQQTSR